jgi:hypothetical protein
VSRPSGLPRPHPHGSPRSGRRLRPDGPQTGCHRSDRSRALLARDPGDPAPPLRADTPARPTSRNGCSKGAHSTRSGRSSGRRSSRREPI